MDIYHAPDRGPTHGFMGVLVDQVGGQIIQAPLTGHAVMLGLYVYTTNCAT
jgi:hypothetical protein